MNTKTKDLIFDIANIIFISLFSLMVFYPFYFVVVNSFNAQLGKGPALLFPKELFLRGYTGIFSTNNIFFAFIISSLRTITGTIIAVLICTIAAYSLRKKDLVYLSLIHISE